MPTTKQQILHKVEYSLAIDGSPESIQLPTLPSATGFSFGFWVFPLGTPSSWTLFNNESADGRDGLFLRQNSGTQMAILGGNASALVINTTAAAPAPGIWTHVAFTHASSNAFVYYLNGVSTSTGSGDMTISANLPRLGRRAYAASAYGRYLFKDICFENVNTAWTAAKVLDLAFKRKLPNAGASYYKTNQRLTDQNGANSLAVAGQFDTNVPSFMR